MAVLVDGENVNTGPAAEVLRGVGGAEKAAVRRVYGNEQMLGPWCETPGFRVVHTHSTKNSADMRLCIDAVHLSHAGGIGAFVIVTSDGDYSHLAHHLRERHFRVIGIGEQKTPETFRAACSQFIEIKGRSRPAVRAAATSSHLSKMDQRLRSSILNNGNSYGLPINSLNALMRKYDVKISATPERTWRNYLLNRATLYDCDPRGPNARVRWIGPKA